MNFRVLKYFLFIAPILLIYLSYVTPMLYAYISSGTFIYVNAWDEETYLTYQGAIGSLSVPGYFFSGIVTLFFQHLGVSGSDQNLLFDIFLVPLTALILYKILINYIENKYLTAYLVTIVLFSSVFFNHANTFLHELYPVRQLQFFMFGYESYLSILRTPNPQLSYFLVAAAIWLFLKFRRAIILFIPLPFLYFYVAMPYIYFLIIYLIYRGLKLEGHNLKNIFILSFIAYLVISCGLIIMDVLFLSRSELVTNPGAYFNTHRFFFPLVAIVALMFLIVQYFLYRKEEKEILLALVVWQLYLFLSLIFMANFQVISGYILSYKNYYDYAFSIIGGCSIAIFLYSLYKSHIHRVMTYAMALITAVFILYFGLNSLGFDFKKLQYKIGVGGSVTEIESSKIKSNPTYALIDDLDYRSKVSYAYSRLISPPFSYQYKYPFIYKQCIYNELLFEGANAYIQKNDLPAERFVFRYEYGLIDEESVHDKGVFGIEEKLKEVSCKRRNYEGDKFFFIQVNRKNYWKYYPDW